jgi:bifunctional polynucleotide phosphatase/kinase
MAASQRDQFRKPMPGMWYELEKIFRDEGVEIRMFNSVGFVYFNDNQSSVDKDASFFVGDAAGRKYPGGKTDFSSTDRKWAENVGIKFLTPEVSLFHFIPADFKGLNKSYSQEYFLKLSQHQNFELPGFRASALLSGLGREFLRCHSPLYHKGFVFLVPRVIPTSTPILPHPPQQQVVLFVGYPCLGKSTFFRQHFQPEGYIHINQDTLKTREKCIKALEETLKAGKSCVVGQSLSLLKSKSQR